MSAAKAHLLHLLDEVARDETITITRLGTAVAQLVPPPANQRADVTIEELRRGVTFGDLTIRGLVDQGRRY